MKSLLALFYVLIFSAITGYAQKIPSLVYDESSGKIQAIYNFDNYDTSFCVGFTPIVGTITQANITEDDISDYSLVLKTVRSSEIINYLDLSIFPGYIIENLKSSLLAKRNKVKIWGSTCGSGRFTYASHIANFKPTSTYEDFPDVRDSILTDDPNEAMKKAQLMLQEIDRKINKITIDFDEEIAPGIPKGSKEEFETSEEAESRLVKLRSLRKSNATKLDKKIYFGTNSLLKEYLKTVGSFYAVPIKVSLDRYDADTESFPLLKDGKEITQIDVPRKNAPVFKESFGKSNAFVDYAIDVSVFAGYLNASAKRIRIEIGGQSFTGPAPF